MDLVQPGRGGAESPGADDGPQDAGSDTVVSSKRARKLRQEMQKRMSDGWSKFVNKGWDKDKIGVDKISPKHIGSIVGDILSNYREAYYLQEGGEMGDVFAGGGVTLAEFTVSHFKHSYGVRQLARTRFSEFLRGLLEVTSRTKFPCGKDIGDKTLTHDDIPWDMDHSKVLVFAQMVGIVDPPFSHIAKVTLHRLLVALEQQCEAELVEAYRASAIQSDVVVTTVNNVKKVIGKLLSPDEGYLPQTREDARVAIEELCVHVEAAPPGRYADPVSEGRSRKFGERLVPVDRFAHWVVKHVQSMYASAVKNLAILEEIFSAELGLSINISEAFRLFVSYLDPDLAGVTIVKDESGMTKEVTTVEEFLDLNELVSLYDACEEATFDIFRNEGKDEEGGPNVTLAGFSATMDRFFNPAQVLTALSHPRWEAFAYAHYKECAGSASAVAARLNVGLAREEESSKHR